MAKFFMVLTISIVILLLSGTIVLLVAAILNPPIYSYPVNSSSNMAEQSVHEASIKDATCNGNIKLLQALSDKYKLDQNIYPSNLKLLIDNKYIQQIPVCPKGNAYIIDKDGKVSEGVVEKQDISTSPSKSVKTFTIEELSKFDGKDGRKAYIAIEGTVYDVTNLSGWNAGSHGHGIEAGKDLTAAFQKLAPNSHKTKDFFKDVPAVGKYTGEPSSKIPEVKSH